MPDFVVGCYFCGQSVAHEGVDPIAMVIVPSWMEEQDVEEQQFFAHAECFRKAGDDSFASQIAVF